MPGWPSISGFSCAQLGESFRYVLGVTFALVVEVRYDVSSVAVALFRSTSSACDMSDRGQERSIRLGKLWAGYVLPANDTVIEVEDAACYCFEVQSGPARGRRFGPRATGIVFQPSQITCWFCRETGHLRRDCLQYATVQPRAPPPGSPDSSSPLADPTALDIVKDLAEVPCPSPMPANVALRCTEDLTPELASCSGQRAGGCSSTHADGLKAPSVMFGPAFGTVIHAHAPTCCRPALTAALENILWKQQPSISWIRFPGRPPGYLVAFLGTQKPAGWRWALPLATCWSYVRSLWIRFPGRPPGTRGTTLYGGPPVSCAHDLVEDGVEDRLCRGWW